MKKLYHFVIKNPALSLATVFAFIGISIGFVFLFKVFQNYNLVNSTTNIDIDATSMVGTYLQGIGAFFFQITIIILIYLTYQSNREELDKINKYNKQLTDYNREIIDFNKNQMIISTYTDLILNIKSISNTFNTEKNISDDNRTVYIRFNKNFIDRLANKFQELDFIDHPKEEQFLLVLKTIDENPNNFYQSEYSVKFIVSAIEETVKYLTEKFSDINRGFYLNKLKSEIYKGDLRNCLLLYGLIDKEFKKIIEDFSLLGEMLTVYKIHYGRPGKRYVVDIDFRKFYNKKAFEV